jgi:hypothetical protein
MRAHGAMRVGHACPMRSAVGGWHAAPQQRVPRMVPYASRELWCARVCIRARMRANVTCDRRVYACARACLTRRASERASACLRAPTVCRKWELPVGENRSAASLYWKDNVRQVVVFGKELIAHQRVTALVQEQHRFVCLFPLFVAHAEPPLHSACRSSRRQWASATQRVRQDRLATSGPRCSPKPHALVGLPYGSLCAPA